MLKKTPIEEYTIKGHKIHVKREDLCCPEPGPPFSKVRGILEHLTNLKNNGITIVGYTETAISMAGWGVAWICKQLGMKAVIFDPKYKNPVDTLLYHRKQWKELDAEIIPIKAGMAKVNWYVCKNLLKEKYPDAILLPLGLPFKETITATSFEIINTLWKMYECHQAPKTIVVNVGSGTIAAGVWKGAAAWIPFHHKYIEVFGIMGRTGNVAKKLKLIEGKAGCFSSGIFSTSKRSFYLKDPGWEYMDKSLAECPFPCHPYYDLKAWQWLIENVNNLAHPILFWNIGH